MIDIERKRIVAIIFMVGLLVLGSIAWQDVKNGKGSTVIKTPRVAKQASEKQLITVNLTGAVNNPGLYKLLPDSRVVDLLEKAGGLLETADKSKVNMARICYEGMHVDVKQLKLNTGKKVKSSKKVIKDENIVVNINTADEFELQKLPGIGPVLANNVVVYRKMNGFFKSVEQLKDVKGIGKVKFEKLKDRVTL